MRCGRTEAAQRGCQGSSFFVVTDREDLLAHGELTKSRNHSLTQVMIDSFHTFPTDLSVTVGVLVIGRWQLRSIFIVDMDGGGGTCGRQRSSCLSLYLILFYKM